MHIMHIAPCHHAFAILFLIGIVYNSNYNIPELHYPGYHEMFSVEERRKRTSTNCGQLTDRTTSLRSN